MCHVSYYEPQSIRIQVRVSSNPPAFRRVPKVKKMVTYEAIPRQTIVEWNEYKPRVEYRTSYVLERVL